ncbi:MAG: hypothetical protein QGG73_10400 [Candidatus Hydrogenedentes bacterium]|jgi:hypothetical protein|nr:hypothetical protein [Candidatus Hydrogenedentota bacterium]
MNHRIAICEPVCQGFEHGPVNTAIIVTALRAYPDASLIFLGKESHLEAVRHLLSKSHPEAVPRAEWRKSAGAATGSNVLTAIRRDLPWCRSLVETAEAASADLLLVCTAMDSGLLALKRVLARPPTGPPVLAFIHGILATIEAAESTKWWRKLVNLRLVLGLKHPAQLRNIALGSSIHAYLQTVAPQFASQFRPFEHPYLWAVDTVPPPREEGPVSFGFFGVNSVNKGFGRFHALARDARDKGLETRFVMAGFVRQSEDCIKYGGAVEGVSNTPLSREEFSARAQRVDYALWTGEPRHYNLTASATFLDALCYVRPGIYLRNRYIEYYFNQMDDIGYLCDSYEEILRLRLADPTVPTLFDLVQT